MKILLALMLSSLSALAQVSYFNQGFLRQPSAAADIAYLGLSPGGLGGVTNFTVTGLPPLFNAAVTDPTTWPHLSFSAVSQNQNLVYASPDGVAGVPTFRSLVSGDIPGVVLSVGNAGVPPAGNALVASSTAPTPTIKTVSAGANVTVTDQGGTNLQISANSGGGGGASGSDLLMTNLTSYANGTNFYIDFSFPAATVLSTGDIAFNYSTNWGLASTSRVCNVYIPATNIFRRILFLTQATNWHDNARTIVAVPCGYGAKLQVQLFGVGETNVAYTPAIDAAPTGTNWIAAGFNPTNSQGGCVAWWEASQQLFQDEYAQTPIVEGVGVRSWGDVANVAGRATNSAVSIFNYWNNPNNSPGNIPSINFVPSGVAYLVTSNFTDIPQVNWAFMMIYGRGSSLICLDGLSEGHRFACQFSESPAIPMAVYSGSSVTATPGAGQIQWRLFAFSQNTTTSVMRTNGVQAATGNSGTQAPGRWTIGSDYNLSTEVGNYRIAEIIIYHTNMTLVQLTNVESYFRTKYKTW